MDITPLHDLVILTPRLSLRVPNHERLQRLADVAARGIHMPGDMPFGDPWTATSSTDPAPCPPDVLRQRVIDYHSRLLDPDAWDDHRTSADARETHTVVLPFTVSLRAYGTGDHADTGYDPYPDPFHTIGVITLRLTLDYLTDHDAPVITVSTGSWLGLTHQRHGYGTEMRAAVLSFAFEHLGATTATSRVHQDNPASAGVSAKLGYALLLSTPIFGPDGRPSSAAPAPLIHHETPFDPVITGRPPVPTLTYAITAADHAALTRTTGHPLATIHVSYRRLTPLVHRIIGTTPPAVHTVHVPTDA